MLTRRDEGSVRTSQYIFYDIPLGNLSQYLTFVSFIWSRETGITIFGLINASKRLGDHATAGHLRELRPRGNVPQYKLGIEQVEACTR